MYDAFISYCHDDKDWVLELAARLRRRQRPGTRKRLRVFLDVDSIGVGENWVAGIERALQESRHIIPVFSRSYFGSKASGWELLQKLIPDLDGKGRTILPCLIEECDIPPRVKHIQYLDFRNFLDPTSDGFAGQFERLVGALKGAKTTARNRTGGGRPLPHLADVHLPAFPYFLYISDSKLEMLEARVAPAEVLLDGHPKVPAGRTRFEAIKSVIAELQRGEQIGDIQSSKPYISGNLNMKWGIVDWGVCDADVRVVFFMDPETSPMLLLAGSAHHVLTSKSAEYEFPKGGFGYSGSHLPGIMRAIREAYDGRWSEMIDGPRDWATSAALCRGELQNIGRGWGRDEIDFSFPTQQVNFVARSLKRISRSSGCSSDPDVLIGTPLYVALSDGH